jgi:hypothetical protein
LLAEAAADLVDRQLRGRPFLTPSEAALVAAVDAADPAPLAARIQRDMQWIVYSFDHDKGNEWADGPFATQEEAEAHIARLSPHGHTHAVLQLMKPAHRLEGWPYVP